MVSVFFEFALIFFLSHASAADRMTEAYLDNWDTVRIRVKAVDYSGDHVERELTFKTKDLYIEGENLIVISPDNGIIETYLLAPFRGKAGTNEKRVLSSFHGVDVSYDVRVIPLNDVRDFQGVVETAQDNRRFLNFGEPTTVSQVPDGGLLAVRGPRQLLRSDRTIEDISKQRDYFGFKYSFTNRDGIKTVLVTESGILLDLDQFPVTDARTTTDARRVYTTMKYKNMRDISRHIERESTGLYGGGNARDFRPGEVKVSMLPRPEKSVNVVLKVESFGPVPGPVYVQDKFAIGPDSVHFPSYQITVPVSQISGIFDYFVVAD